MNLSHLPDFDGLDDLFKEVLKEFRLDPYGTHGIPHWRRVLRNGMAICDHDASVDRLVVTLFALLHDSCRQDEYEDVEHGLRGARFLDWLQQNGMLPDLNAGQYIQLKAAILDHPNGFVAHDHTIQACWDADRLDLPRVGIMPDPALMSSRYAKRDDTIERVWEEAWGEATA